MKNHVAEAEEQVRVKREIKAQSTWRERALEAAILVTEMKFMLSGSGVRWPPGLKERVEALRDRWPRSHG